MVTEGAGVMSAVVGTDVVDFDGVNVSVFSVGAAAMNAIAAMVVVVVELTIVLVLQRARGSCASLKPF